MVTSILVVPHFIEAESKEDLVRLMLALQTRLKKKLHFFDIQKDGKKWVAWYELDKRTEFMAPAKGDS